MSVLGCLMLVFGASLAQTNFFIFKNYLVTRDEAHFCCRKYGMTLLSIRSPQTNTFLTKSLVDSQHTAIWLGIFNNPTNLQEVIWSNYTNIEYNNFDNQTKDTVGSLAAANQTQTDNFCVYGDVGNHLTWKATHCGQKLDFGCEIIGSNISVLPASAQDVLCPALLKMTSNNINRGGAFISSKSPERIGAGMYAYFKREDMVYSLGRGVGYEKTEGNIECLLQCLITSDCNGVIILDKFHCLLYHQ